MSALVNRLKTNKQTWTSQDTTNTSIEFTFNKESTSYLLGNINPRKLVAHGCNGCTAFRTTFKTK